MKKYRILYALLALFVVFIGFKFFARSSNDSSHDEVLTREDLPKSSNLSEIYLAGGCFWGVEGYFKKIAGVIDTDVGYANGKSSDTNYKKISRTDHSETVKLTYDPDVVSLQDILEYYFRIIDPTSVNKQGNDEGRQYRTGIYF